MTRIRNERTVHLPFGVTHGARVLAKQPRAEGRTSMDEVTRRLLNRNVAALADGDRGAFDPVYRTLWPLLTQFIAAIRGPVNMSRPPRLEPP
jgi:hypothetical protein